MDYFRYKRRSRILANTQTEHYKASDSNPETDVVPWDFDTNLTTDHLGNLIARQAPSLKTQDLI